jgi:single-strand DNA-binding protein
MNKVVLIGRLTKDPELRYTQSNIANTTFSIAVDRQYTTQEGKKETDYINIVVWRKQAENVKKYCLKGHLVAVSGSIQTRTYDDKDGKKVYVTEVIADNVQFLESKKVEQQESVQAVEGNGHYQESNTTLEEPSGDEPYIEFGANIELNDDDLPFN